MVEVPGEIEVVSTGAEAADDDEDGGGFFSSNGTDPAPPVPLVFLVIVDDFLPLLILT